MATNPQAPIDLSGYPLHPAAEPPRARGDAITGDRYWSKEFAAREWEHMWKKIWHVGGRVSQLEEPGDFITHQFMHESVLMTMQEDGSIKAFLNVCKHRGNRLVSTSEGGVRAISCAPTTTGNGASTVCSPRYRIPRISRLIRAAS